MCRRRIIRSLFILPILLFAAAWLWSGTHWGVIVYRHDGREVRCWSQGGVTAMSFARCAGWPNGWFSEIEPQTPACYWPTNMRLRSALGFGCTHYAPGSPTYVVIVPYWFFILASAGVFVLVWRKTRPSKPAGAFPVEIGVKHD